MENKVKQLLQENERTVAWLSRKLDVDRATLRRKLSGEGKFTRVDLLALCQLFGVSMDYFEEVEK